MAGKNELKAALASRDPDGVAKALELPPISKQKSQTQTQKSHSLQLKDMDGTDWSNVLSSWQNASDAAEQVSLWI